MENWLRLPRSCPFPRKKNCNSSRKSAWRYIGKGASSYDLADICTGKAGYGMDARLDGMLYASVEHPPVLGGKVKSYDEKAPLQVKGVKQTIPIKPFTPPHQFQPLGGVAVIADNTWAAFQGRKKLNVAWDNGPNASYNSDPYKKELQETARKPGKVARNIGDVDAAFAKGGKIVEAEYYVPHAGARSDGAAGRTRRFPGWQSHDLGIHPESAGGAGDGRPGNLASPKKT